MARDTFGSRVEGAPVPVKEKVDFEGLTWANLSSKHFNALRGMATVPEAVTAINKIEAAVAQLQADIEFYKNK